MYSNSIPPARMKLFSALYFLAYVHSKVLELIKSSTFSQNFVQRQYSVFPSPTHVNTPHRPPEEVLHLIVIRLKVDGLVVKLVNLL